METTETSKAGEFELEENTQTVTEQTTKMGDLRQEEIQYLRDRTAQLFEVMKMCEHDPEQVQLCRNEIVELNIRLVPHVLKKYRPFGDDEFQMGCVGLIIATNTFDASRNVQFPNYACFCIERELHKAHRHLRDTFEYQMGENLSSLDEMLSLGNGDEVDKYDVVPDGQAEEEFAKIIEENDLGDFFDNTILPAIENIASKTKGQVTNVDFEVWKQLELNYILEMAQIDSQKARITLSTIARTLGVSVQNIRMRHQRVIEAIKERCDELGIRC